MFSDIKIRHENVFFLSYILAVLFAAVLIFFSIMMAGANHRNVNYSVDKNIETVEEYENAISKADESIVLFGNSRLRHALRFGFDPHETVALPDGKKLAILQFAQNGALFSNYSTIAPHVLKARPDYIFLTSQILTITRGEGGFFRRYPKAVFEYIYSIVRPKDLYQDWWELRTDLVHNCIDNFLYKDLDEQMKLVSERDYHSLDSKENKDLADMRMFVRSALMRGIKVIILDLPPNMELLDRYDVPVDRLDYYGIGHSPTPEEVFPELHDQIIWLDYVHPNGSEDYCDVVHLNKNGRDIFQEWFFKTLPTL